MPGYYLGLDLGGTNVKAGLTDSHGRLLQNVTVPTGESEADLAPGPVIDRMVGAARLAMERAAVRRNQVAAVGVLSPGQASLARGIVLRAANLPLWKNVRLRARISRGLGIPAVFENDARAAAFGEWWAGAAQRHRIDSFFMFTLGTGVGGGFVHHGKVLDGAFGYATEIAHTIIVPGGEPCGCGQRGCLERYCSAKNTGLRATHQLAESNDLRQTSTLGKVFEQDGAVTSADIAQHARAGDRFALEVWNDTCRILALACINVCHILDPQMIALGGGMAQAGRFLLDNVQQHFRAQWWQMTKPTAKIVLAKLGNDAGIIGAAGVAKEAHERGALPRIGR